MHCSYRRAIDSKPPTEVNLYPKHSIATPLPHFRLDTPSTISTLVTTIFTDCCRQIHPLYGEKAGLLGYCDPLGNAENFPPAPNIVVEGGRIEFVRPSQDGTTTPRRNTMSRGSQTFNDESEKSDPAKVSRLFRFPSVVQLPPRVCFRPYLHNRAGWKEDVGFSELRQ